MTYQPREFTKAKTGGRPTSFTPAKKTRSKGPLLSIVVPVKD